MIGSLLLNDKVFADLGELKGEHFYRPAHQVIFQTIQQMFNDGEQVDPTLVYAKLEKNKDIRRVGGAPFLHTCIEDVPTTANAGYYANIVIDKWKIRTANQLGMRLQQITEDVDEVPAALDAIRTFLDEADAEAESDSLDFRELYAAWVEDQADDRPVIETPWVALNDKLNGGLQRQRLYVIGARPGCGKTIMLTQMALYATKLHQKALFFSLELSKEDLMGRILACGAHVPYDEITKRRLSADTRGKIDRWVAAAAESTLEVDDRPDLTIEEIAQACRIEKQRNGLDFVCIDYLQYVEASVGNGRVEAIDHIAKRARSIARKLDCCVVVAAQLNRKLDDPANGKPRLPNKSDFRESGGIEQTADAAWILSRPPDDHGEESRIPMMNVTVVKNRTGTEGTLQLVERFDMASFQ